MIVGVVKIATGAENLVALVDELLLRCDDLELYTLLESVLEELQDIRERLFEYILSKEQGDERDDSGS